MNKKTKKKKIDNPFYSPEIDPFGSWTGISSDSKYEIPQQDADDL